MLMLLSFVDSNFFTTVKTVSITVYDHDNGQYRVNSQLLSLVIYAKNPEYVLF